MVCEGSVSGAALLAAVTSALAYNFYFTAPHRTFRVDNPADLPMPGAVGAAIVTSVYASAHLVNVVARVTDAAKLLRELAGTDPQGREVAVWIRLTPTTPKPRSVARRSNRASASGASFCCS